MITFHPKMEKSGLFAFYGGLLLGAAALFFLLVSFRTEQAKNNAAITIHMHELLAPVAKHKNEDDVITIVMLGNSRLRHALDIGFNPDTPHKLPDGQQLYALQFAQNVALFEFYAPVWNAILAAKPDILVIQNALLTTARRQQDTIFAGPSRDLFNGLMLKWQDKTPLQAWQDERAHLIKEMCMNRADYNRASIQSRIIFAARRDHHQLNGNPQTAMLRKAIRQAHALGVKIVMTDFPVNHDQIARFNIPAHHLIHYGLGFAPTQEKLLPALYDKVTWLEPQPMKASAFCDYVHLNERGRMAYTDWFLKEIATITGSHSADQPRSGLN